MGGSPQTQRGSEPKRCTRCGIIKPIDEFHKHSTGKLRPDCKECVLPLNREAHTKRLLGDPDYNRRHALMRKFGVTVDDYEARLEQQGGVCGICGERCDTGRRLAVDHDHDTGAIRGLLCRGCNTGLGNLKDRPDLLASALIYLSEHGRALETEDVLVLLKATKDSGAPLAS